MLLLPKIFINITLELTLFQFYPLIQQSLSQFEYRGVNLGDENKFPKLSDAR